MIREAFSVLAAARLWPRRPAVVLAESHQTLTFGDLAERVAQRCQQLRGELGDERPPASAPRTLIPTLQLHSLVELYAHLELGWPMRLLHERWTAAERDAARVATAEPPTEGCAVVLYTTGSTGRPKAIPLSRHNLLASAAASAANLGWRDDDRWLLCMPLGHVGGLSIVTRCLAARAALVLAPRFAADQVVHWIEHDGVTLMSLVPTLVERLLAATATWRPPKTLRALLVGGDGAPRPLLARACALGWPVLTTYGMTETCSQLATQPYPTAGTLQPGCGRPLLGVELRITGPTRVIEVRGRMVSAACGADWWPTRDLGALDADGHLSVLGRLEQLIISGGENVAPMEVERVLEAHPAVNAALVVGRPDPQWGQRVEALVELVAGTAVDWVELAHFAAARLAPFKRPKRVHVVDRLPRSEGGKLDRSAAARSLDRTESVEP